MKKISVRINKIDGFIDEVFLYREDPYVNRTVYAKPGIFTAGEVSDEDAAALEQDSKDQIAKERADKLAEEAKTAEAEEAKTKEKATKTAAKKREG